MARSDSDKLSIPTLALECDPAGPDPTARPGLVSLVIPVLAPNGPESDKFCALRAQASGPHGPEARLASLVIPVLAQRARYWTND